MSPAVPLVGIFGPTALGKTEIALALAERLDGEIVTADSMQVYSGLPILTNQPRTGEVGGIAHHLVAFVDPQREFSVAEYARLARQTLSEIAGRGRTAVIEGGSGLYVRAAFGTLGFGVPPNRALRVELEQRIAADPAAVYADLARADPEAAARVDRANPRRVVRALEIALTRGDGARPAGDRLWAAGAGSGGGRLFALEPDRDELRARIDARIDRMFGDGLVAEVEALLRSGTPSRTVVQAIGVRECAALLAGQIDLDEAVASMRSRTRRLVRRQLTWMRKLPDAVRIATAGRSPGDVVQEIIRRLP
jgi:tRNA dimethylallyltransferase